MCKNWIENGYCRYRNECKFAHGAEELQLYEKPAGELKGNKNKNCKTFYATKQCLYGVRCLFRHEYRHINQIKRYPYTVKLYTYESLYSTSIDQEEFVNSYDNGAPRLQIFEQIHSMGDEEEKLAAKQKTSSSSCSEFENEADSQIDNSTGSSHDSTEAENQDYSGEITEQPYPSQKAQDPWETINHFYLSD